MPGNQDSTSGTSDEASTQQLLLLHVWLKGLSPMVWRRLLVRDDISLGDLHYVLQIAFSWDDSHLNHFHIHGRDYCVYHEGGVVMYDDALQAKLSDFSLRQNEKFLYEYDLNVPWQHVIRVEKILPLDKGIYPKCISAQGIAPPEDCGGREGFLAIPKFHTPNSDLLQQSIEIGVRGAMERKVRLRARGGA